MDEKRELFKRLMVLLQNDHELDLLFDEMFDLIDQMNAQEQAIKNRLDKLLKGVKRNEKTDVAFDDLPFDDLPKS